MNTTIAPETYLGVPRVNCHGYQDSTAYWALKHLQRAEFGYRPIVCICSPYSGDMTANVALACEFCARAVAKRVIPLAPHLHYRQFTNDDDPDARELRMIFNRILLTKCEGIWVYTGRMSGGMHAEIKWAQQLAIPATYLDERFEEVTL